MNQNRIGGKPGGRERVSGSGSQERVHAHTTPVERSEDTKEADGLEPAPITQPPSPHTVDSSAQKLRHSASDGAETGDRVSRETGDEVVIDADTTASLPPSNAGADRRELAITVEDADDSRACCPSDVKYIAGCAVLVGVSLTAAVVFGVFGDRFDEDPSTEAIKTHLPLTVVITLFAGAFLGSCLGKAFHRFWAD